jgi:protein-tyrosine phosphatase
VSAPAPSTLPDGHIDVEGCTNFRDAGGWDLAPGGRMRVGRLYRADDPLRVTAAGRCAVDALGLAATVDLRQHSQFLRGPGFLPHERTSHIPLVDRVIDPDDPQRIEGPTDLADLYEGMLTSSGEPIARALDAIATGLADGPVLVHCAFGKDRTGLLCALVQAAIGVPGNSIVADYHRSLAEPLPDDPPTGHVPPMLFTAPAEAMDVLLARALATHGSLPAWAASFPTAPDTMDRLHHELVEH